jgi:hypothetical protein
VNYFMPGYSTKAPIIHKIMKDNKVNIHCTEQAAH